MIPKSHQVFVNQVNRLAGDEYAVLSEYKNAKAKILMKHVKCKHQWLCYPSNFLKGTRCPKCHNRARKTTEQFRNEVYQKVSDEYLVLGKYKQANKKN